MTNKKIKINVPKRVLLFLASLVWAIAGLNILRIALEELAITKHLYLLGVFGGILGFIAFFKFVFYKMYKKHTFRIVNMENERPCIFSFFDKKGYIIMIFMITVGIFLRAYNLISGIPLIILYLSLGFALSSASIAFLISGINYKKTLEKYIIK